MNRVRQSHSGAHVADHDRIRGVSARLLGAIFVPVVVLTMVLGASVRQSHRNVERLQSVSSEVAVLDQLVTLRAAVYNERLTAEILVPSRRPPAELLRSTEFGTQILERPEELASTTDAALKAIEPTQRPFSSRALDRARQQRAGNSDADQGGPGRFDPLDDATERAVSERLTVVREAAVELGDVRLIRSGTAFQRSVELPEEAGTLVANLADLWSAEAPARPALQSKVAMSIATFDESSARFEASVTPSQVTADWSAEVPDMPATLRSAVDLAVSGGLSAADQEPYPPAVGVALLDGVDWLLHINAVPEHAATAATATARQVEASARAAERTNAGLALAAVVSSIVTAMLFGRSIVRPVGRLASQAEQIGQGQLGVNLLATHGPPEIVRASQAMNDMVDNLVLLEQKSQALTHADFDHPALQQQLPGRLGASLQQSMEVLSDSIEQRESLQARLRFDATHDSLTGVGNRAALIDALSALHEPSRSTTVPAAAIFIDLNNFKGVNDRHGHAGGDDVLKTVAQRMLAAVPASATVARLGGDEFVVALPIVSDVDEAVEIARRVVVAVSEPIDLDGRTIAVGASAGVAVSGHGSASFGVEALLRMADLAVYSAKLNPREDIVVYDNDLDSRLTHQRDVETSLSQTLRSNDGQLRLVFQPIVGAADFGTSGFEALLRWDRPDRSPIAPDEFIPIAERSDLILEIDRWVLSQALTQMKRWVDDESLPPFTLSVNMSGRSLLDRSFVGRVTDALSRSGVPAALLHLEVTETALVSDLELAASQLAQLRALGVSVVIDDFGTGFTSVAHLRALPVDVLKIDGGFVQRMDKDDNRVLVELIARLAQQLGIPTVAEGVETIEQARVLRELGCDFLQGYYFSAPIDVDDVATWLEDRGTGHDDQTRRPASQLLTADRR